MEPVQLAAVLAGLVLLASMLSVELGMPVDPDRAHRHHALPDPSGILTGPAAGTEMAEDVPS